MARIPLSKPGQAPSRLRDHPRRTEASVVRSSPQRRIPRCGKEKKRRGRPGVAEEEEPAGGTREKPNKKAAQALADLRAKLKESLGASGNQGAPGTGLKESETPGTSSRAVAPVPKAKEFEPWHGWVDECREAVDERRVGGTSSGKKSRFALKALVDLASRAAGSGTQTGAKRKKRKRGDEKALKALRAVLKPKKDAKKKKKKKRKTQDGGDSPGGSSGGSGDSSEEDEEEDDSSDCSSGGESSEEKRARRLQAPLKRRSEKKKGECDPVTPRTDRRTGAGQLLLLRRSF